MRTHILYAHLINVERQNRDLSLEIPSNEEHAANIDALIIDAADE